MPLKDVNPASQVNFLPLSSMYMGAKIALHVCLSKEEYRQRAPDVQYFLKCVQGFYIEAASQIRNRFPTGDLIIEMLQVFNPAASHAKFPSLVPLAANFPNIVSESQLQTLDNQWCRLAFISLPFQSDDMEPEEFWGLLNKITDGTGDPQFGILSAFMQNLLCLPHANVDVERVFSSVSSIKTKARNRLHTKTVRALLKVKEGCVMFSRTPRPPVAKQRMSSDILYANADSDSEPDTDL